MIRKKSINELGVRGKIEEFRISPQNLYLALSEEADLSIQAIAVGGKIVRRNTGKLSQETKDLIKNR